MIFKSTRLLIRKYQAILKGVVIDSKMIGNALSELSSANAAMQELHASQYPRFADVMNKFGYDWEPMTVTTDDDYILTTFHILG